MGQVGKVEDEFLCADMVVEVVRVSLLWSWLVSPVSVKEHWSRGAGKIYPTRNLWPPFLPPTCQTFMCPGSLEQRDVYDHHCFSEVAVQEVLPG